MILTIKLILYWVVKLLYIYIIFFLFNILIFPKYYSLSFQILLFTYFITLFTYGIVNKHYNVTILIHFTLILFFKQKEIFYALKKYYPMLNWRIKYFLFQNCKYFTILWVSRKKYNNNNNILLRIHRVEIIPIDIQFYFLR